MSEAVAALFTRSDGTFRFARWGRPIAPVVFGTDAAGEALMQAALRAVAGLARLDLVDLDPELGANLLIFFCNDWAELRGVPHLDRLIPDLARLVTVLQAAGANQYRIYGCDEAGAIRLCVTLLRYDADLQSLGAEALALGQMVQAMLLWSDHAFTSRSPVAWAEGRAVVRPDLAALITAAYDPVLPAAARDPAFALRLAARLPG